MHNSLRTEFLYPSLRRVLGYQTLIKLSGRVSSVCLERMEKCVAHDLDLNRDAAIQAMADVLFNRVY